MADVTAILLAAGQSRRMQGGLPKLLHPVLGRTVLGHVLDAIEAGGIADVVVVVGPDCEALRKTCEDRALRFAVQPSPRGTADAVRCALEAGPTGATVLVACADAPLVRAESFAALLRRRRESGAACVVLTARLEQPDAYGRVLRDEAGRVQAIVEAADADAHTLALQEINTGAYAFDAAALRAALPTLATGNAQGELYLTDTVRALVGEGRAVEALQAQDPAEALGVNDRADLARVAAALRGRVLRRHMAAGVTVIDPASTWIDVDVRIGADTVVHPFTVISGTVQVGARCQLGPFTHLRDGTVLEDGAEVGNFVEVKQTRLGAGAKAKHLSYLGDGEVGARANIGAGTIFANYDGRTKQRTEVGEEAFIGSGTVLVAPVRVGRGAVTGAGAVVLRGRDVPAGETAVGVPARLLGRTVVGKGAGEA